MSESVSENLPPPRLLIKGYSDTPGGKKITVYNPFNSGFEEIGVTLDVNGHMI